MGLIKTVNEILVEMAEFNVAPETIQIEIDALEIELSTFIGQGVTSIVEQHHS